MHARMTTKKNPPIQHKKGRVCKKRGCKKRLSVYNPDPYCHSHHREFQDKLD